MKENKFNLKRIIYIVIITILFCILCFSTYNYFTNNQSNKNVLPQNNQNINIDETKNETEKEQALKSFTSNTDLSSARTEHNNEDIVARLEIPALFNILVTKTTDNDYYLTHSIKRKNDKKGTEFLDYRTGPDAKQVNIYGHNSRTYDIPFRKLESFLNEEFFNNNPYILLQHDNATRIYKIFSIKEVTDDYEHMIVEVEKENMVEHINILKNNSIYTREVEYNETSNLLILQTCSYNSDDTYYIISAIEIN